MRHFTLELEELNAKLLQMGSLVESAIRKSVRSLTERDEHLALEVLESEPVINRMEMEIDGMATRLLALRQPVACDLRLLTAALKINTDLERIGDLAAVIAKNSRSLVKHTYLKPPAEIPEMESLVRSMLLKCLDAFVRRDADLARTVLDADERVNHLRDIVYKELVETMRGDPSLVPAAVDLIFVGRNLERIGDHTTNIAEDVVFLLKGIDIRRPAKLAI